MGIMEFQRRFVTKNDCLSTENRLEIAPQGAIFYSSGIPSNRNSMLKLFNRSNTNASVHALIDDTGVTQTLPLSVKGWHSGTHAGNTEYLGIMVCEPMSTAARLDELRDLTYDNLVEYCVFVCRYLAIEPDLVSTLIRFAGEPGCKDIVVPEAVRSSHLCPDYFNGTVDGSDGALSPYCNGDTVRTAVKQTLGQIAELYREADHTSETPLTQMGTGVVVLWKGGDLFTSRGSSTRANFAQCMHHGVILEMAPGSRHACRVAFTDGTIYWVNKGDLMVSPLGHVSY